MYVAELKFATELHTHTHKINNGLTQDLFGFIFKLLVIRTLCTHTHQNIPEHTQAHTHMDTLLLSRETYTYLHMCVII